MIIIYYPIRRRKMSTKTNRSNVGYTQHIISQHSQRPQRPTQMRQQQKSMLPIIVVAVVMIMAIGVLAALLLMTSKPAGLTAETLADNQQTYTNLGVICIELSAGGATVPAANCRQAIENLKACHATAGNREQSLDCYKTPAFIAQFCAAKNWTSSTATVAKCISDYSASIDALK